MRRIKLGILQTNHDKSVEVGDAYPDDAHRFRDLFDAQDERFEYRVYMTIGGHVPQDIDEHDAFVITGSPLSVLDDHIFTKDLFDFIFKHHSKVTSIGDMFSRTAFNSDISNWYV